MMKIGNLEVYGVIYKITNLVNNKVYIGQTTYKRGFKDRYNSAGIPIEKVYKHHNKFKKENKSFNKHLLYSIEKYGFDTFEVCEVFDVAFSQDELNIKEQCWISIYKSINPSYGYNSQSGGLNFKVSEQTKEKMRNNNIGKNNPMYGVHRYGKDNPNYGKRWTKEQREHLSKYKKENPVNNKKIVCLNNRKIFNSISEASEYFNIGTGTIVNCLKHRIKTIGKLKEGIPLQWMYYDDYITKSERELQVIFKLNTSGNKDFDPIICIETGIVYESHSIATKKLNKNTNAIGNCCKGYTQTAYGFHWKYIKDLTEEEYINYNIEEKLRELDLII